MIALSDISKVYQTKSNKFSALDHIDLAIDAGETVAIMGKSGAGKTTLLNLLGCLDTQTTGKYQLDGVEISGLSDAKLAKIRNDKIGFVIQDFALLPHESVLFNVMLPMYFDKTPIREMQKKAAAALDHVGLANQKRKRVNQLSGGQQQRVAIARAIVKQPKLVLADEPTGALDSQTGKQVMDILLGLNQNNTTVVIVTHDEQIASYCGRKIVISDGTILSDTKTEAAAAN